MLLEGSDSFVIKGVRPQNAGFSIYIIIPGKWLLPCGLDIIII